MKRSAAGRACDDGSCAEPNRVFESANRGGADGDDATRRAECVVDGGGGVGGDGVRLGMDLVILDALDADGLEGSQADVQGDIDGLDAALADAVEDFWGEMKAGGGSGYRSALLGIDGLVAFAIAGRIGTRDIGRERDVADAIEGSEEIVGAARDGLKADAALAEFPAGEDLGLQVRRDCAPPKNRRSPTPILRPGRTRHSQSLGWVESLAGQQNLDAAVEEIAGRRISRADRLSTGAFAAAIEAGGKNAGVVENHEIAGVQQVREVAEQAVGMAAGSLQVEHAGAVAGGEGFLGNEVVGKMEVEVGDQHGVRL